MCVAAFTDSFISVSPKNSTDINELSAKVEEDTTKNENVSLLANPVPQTDDKMGSAYLTNCLFIGDSILSGLSENSNVSSAHIKSGVSYILTNISADMEDFSSQNIYLMLGMTELEEQSADSLISTYDEVIRDFKVKYPDSDIYVLSLVPVSEDNMTLFNSTIDDFNSKLLSVANTESVHYVDINTALKDNAGYLSENYYESGSLNDAAYEKIIDYILYHTIN
jgi:hypothetical protein